MNWFVIWVPSSTTEMRRRRDTAPEEMTRTKTAAAGGGGGDENNLRDGEESSSELTRVTSVVSGKFAVTGVKEDGDEKVNGKSLPSRKTSLFDVSKVEEAPVLNGTVLKDATPERRVSSSQNTTDVTKQDTNNVKDESQALRVGSFGDVCENLCKASACCEGMGAVHTNTETQEYAVTKCTDQYDNRNGELCKIYEQIIKIASKTIPKPLQVGSRRPLEST